MLTLAGSEELKLTESNNRRAEYQAKLKDPRWQKKRLEIYQRDGFECQACRSKTRTLHLHHWKYFPGDPWDCPPEYLGTLCEDCHEFETFYRKEIEKDLIESLRSMPASAIDALRAAVNSRIENLDKALIALDWPTPKSPGETE